MGLKVGIGPDGCVISVLAIYSFTSDVVPQVR
jgi:hypothetical protein